MYVQSVATEHAAAPARLPSVTFTVVTPERSAKTARPSSDLASSCQHQRVFVLILRSAGDRASVIYPTAIVISVDSDGTRPQQGVAGTQNCNCHAT
jgi:hypothetical protein